MKDEKPLHVRVAEALGMKPKRVRVRGTADQHVEVWSTNRYWLADGAHTAAELAALTPPHYELDWSATGPLIERYTIDVWYVPAVFEGVGSEWRATNETRAHEGCCEGPTPLIAVCKLLISLAAAGKLEDSGKDRGTP